MNHWDEIQIVLSQYLWQLAAIQRSGFRSCQSPPSPRVESSLGWADASVGHIIQRGHADIAQCQSKVGHLIGEHLKMNIAYYLEHCESKQDISGSKSSNLKVNCGSHLLRIGAPWKRRNRLKFGSARVKIVNIEERLKGWHVVANLLRKCKIDTFIYVWPNAQWSHCQLEVA